MKSAAIIIPLRQPTAIKNYTLTQTISISKTERLKCDISIIIT